MNWRDRNWPAWRKWAVPGLAAALAAMVIFPRTGHGEAASASVHMAQPMNREQRPQDGNKVELERLKRQKAPDGTVQDVGDVFKATSWYVAPPPPPPPPPAPPTAPPLPFTYMGHYQDAAALVVMLAKGDRLYTVTEGDVIDGLYRVKRITDHAVDLVYLPMNIDQSISTTDASAAGQSHAGANGRP